MKVIPNQTITVSRLSKNQHTVDSLQKLLEANTPAYLEMTGLPARDNEAAELFDECPPNIKPDEKIIMGLMVGNDIKGVVDLAPGYPDQSTVFLGLLLISQELQGHQFGKKLY